MGTHPRRRVAALARGAAVNAPNKTGVTPLIAAEKNGFPEIATLLKQHGAR